MIYNQTWQLDIHYGLELPTCLVEKTHENQAGATFDCWDGKKFSGKSRYVYTYFPSGWGFGTFGLFFHILGMSSSQLTNSIIFQRGRLKAPTRSLLTIINHIITIINHIPTIITIQQTYINHILTIVTTSLLLVLGCSQALDIASRTTLARAPWWRREAPVSFFFFFCGDLTIKDHAISWGYHIVMVNDGNIW